MKNLTITIIVLLVLSSCASTPEDNYRYKKFDLYIEEHQLVSLSKVRTFKMLSWSSLDYRHLILSSHHKKKYLIKLENFCHELDFATSIALKQSMNYSLSAKFDSIIVVDRQNQECRIKSIYEIDEAQAKELLALRKAKTEKK